MADTTVFETWTGDDWSATVTCKSGGVAQNITGWTLYFSVARDQDGPLILTQTVTVHTSPTTGVSAIGLTSAQTKTTLGAGRYWGEVVAKNGAGNHETRGVFWLTINQRLLA
jgi:hypothetical protein